MGAHDHFAQNKALVEGLARRICARHHIYGDERQDFTQDLWIHVIKDDYAVLRKYQGRSTLETFLTSVVANFARDFREKKWGKWRLSRAAQDLGTVAQQLDTLISREGLTMNEACEVLKTRGVTSTRSELDAMFAAFPVRRRHREVQPDEDGSDPPSDVRTDEGLTSEEVRQAAARVRLVLKEVVGGLPPRDRLIIKLRFHDGMTQVAIARLLKIESKLFFRLGDKLAAELRRSLEARGLTRPEIIDVLERRGLAALEGVDE